ncbi:MAG: bifunctional folylpolyglutamate synthase/dihydrofolate synthase [Bacteroidales bacterium]
MTYSQTIEYLFARLPMYHRVGAQAYKANLDNTVALCNLLENPQDHFKAIHITGTNGKGSVSHMLASILQAAGYRTGLYTSPHLVDFRERIRVNGKMISKRFVTSFVGKYRGQYECFEPSFFELTVGMAFEYFRQQKVEIAVIEVGLGGRLDSTNIITPVLSVITNVSLDHMQFLGDTHEKIAAEKAGIIKPGIPVIIGETQQDTTAVFQEKALSCHSEIHFADQSFRADNFRLTGKYSGSQTMDIYQENKPYLTGLISPLCGMYQRKNILTAVSACEKLTMLGIQLPASIIRTGIKEVISRTGFSGRWQVLARKPLTICDTGHNEGGLREVLAQIAATPHVHLHFVFGVVNDKHLAPILKMLPGGATYYFCKPDIPRGLDGAELQRSAVEAGLSGICYPTVKSALRAAQNAANQDDLVFVGGSTFVVAEVVPSPA